MKKILKDNVRLDTRMDHYYNPINNEMVLDCDLEYKNQVMTRLITMLADMKPTRARMDKLLNLGHSNPYNMQ